MHIAILPLSLKASQMAAVAIYQKENANNEISKMKILCNTC